MEHAHFVWTMLDITVKKQVPFANCRRTQRASGGTYFCKLNVHVGYCQIWMNHVDETKMAFKTHHKHFHFQVMPFGLTNAPTTFQ